MAAAVVTSGSIGNCFDRTDVNTCSYVRVDHHWRHRVEEAQRVDETFESMHHVDSDNSADVSTDHANVFMTKNVMHQRVQIAAVGDEVVGIGFREIRIAMSPKVGNNDLKTSSNKRFDIAPPNALRFRIAVNQKERISADTFTDISEFKTVSDIGTMNRECITGGCRRLGRTQPNVITGDAHATVPASNNASISASERPIDANTSRVCWPSSGAPERACQGVP